MEKLNEFFQDSNNKIIAIGIGIVLVIIIVVLIIFFAQKKDSTSSATSTASGTSTMPGMPGSTMPGMPGTPGMPGSTMPGMGMGGSPSMPGMPGGMGMQSNSAQAPAPEAPKPEELASIKPLEAGRIDPFAPIGVTKVSATTTFGNKTRINLPTDMQMIAFTEFDFSKIGKVNPPKTKAELEAERREKEGEILKPSNIRLSGIMSVNGDNTALFYVATNRGFNNEAVKVGDELTFGYDSSGKKMTAKLKSININNSSVVLEPTVGKITTWTYQVTSGISNTGGSMTPGMPGMGMPGMGGSMTPGMPGMGMPGMGGSMTPGMPGMGMPGMGGSMMPGMPGMGMPGMGGYGY